MADDPDPSGLRAPANPVIEEMSLRRRWTPGRIALQSAGLIGGIGLLVWAVRLSMSEENARSVEAMRSAPASEVLLLIGLSLASLVLNGLMFWVTLRPVHRLGAIDTILTNSIATFLSILPFKLSLIMRVLIHHRRDGVRFKVLVGWVAAMGALGVAFLGPLVAAGLWRGRMDALWWLATLGGIAAGCIAAVTLGRWSERAGWLARLSLGSHQIVRHVSAVMGHAALRSADVAVLAGRFLAAAMIVDAPLPIEQAVLLSTTYFLLSVVTPAGTLGFREMGVAALGLSQGLDERSVALIALVVTGAEVLVSGGMALIAAVRLRPDRLLARRGV